MRHRALSIGEMKGIMPMIGGVVLALALMISFGLDFSNTTQGGAIDLRNRITGARLFQDGKDAYHYKWQAGDPDWFCDVYNNPKLPVSKTTATPAMLLVTLPLAALPYRLGEFLWLFAQWALLLGTGWLWLRTAATPVQRWWIAAFLAAFTYTAEWRLHVERGQSYVLLLFLFAAWLTLTLDPKRNRGFWAGCLTGLLAALRPPFLLLVPFLALHRRNQLAGCAVGLLLGFGLPLLVHPAGWNDYFSAMQTHSELYRSDIDPRPGQQHYPATIEGTSTDLLASYAAISYADFSAHALLRSWGLAPFPALPLLLVAVVPFGFWLWLSREQPAERLLPGLAAWFFVADLFLPAYRNSYNDVLILNVIALALVTARKIPWTLAPCALALPLGWYIYVVAPEEPWLINLPTACFTLSAVLLLFLFTKRGVVPKVGRVC
jgi:hypothetical protein